MNKNRWLPITAISLTLIGGSLLITGCDDNSSGAGQAQMPPAQVEIMTAKPEAIEVTTVLPARTSAFRIAEIRPQVSGTILKRLFVEGSDVKQGDSLYLIDPAIYQATYNSAKADLASAKADAEVNRLTIKRYKSLLNSKSISQHEYDRAVATAAQAEARVGIAQAALDKAEIDLAYTKVYSPIDGRISKSNFTEGALVTAGQATALTTVQQLHPIYVDMTQSSAEYLRLKQALADGTLKQKDGKALVKLTLENGQPYDKEGTLEFSDVSVNETTGSISIRAIFDNPDAVLLPGMFVRTTLNNGTQNNIFLIPQRAVTRDAKGNTSVKIVGEGNVIETRVIEVTEAIGSNWIVVKGIKEGDKIVTSGLQKIADKSVVEIKSTAVPVEQAANGSQPAAAE